MFASVKLSFILFLDSFTSPDEYENISYVFKLMQKTSKQPLYTPNTNITINNYNNRNNNNNNTDDITSDINNYESNIPEMLRTISEKKPGTR